MKILHLLILAVIQGAAELLPVSSSAHVIVAEKLLGLDPTAPEMTFLLVMLHTGTMFAVLIYFWPRWKSSLSPDLRFDFAKFLLIATAATGIVGYGLKEVVERFLLGGDHAEIETLFGKLPLIAAALFGVGLLILCAGWKENPKANDPLNTKRSLWIGIVQGLCLPFRGFSRSGATISTGLLQGLSRETSEDFSFALAVILTPPVILHELHRLMKSAPKEMIHRLGAVHLVTDGLIGMCFSFGAGLLALRWLSSWLEKGRWKYFGYYCLAASIAILFLSFGKRLEAHSLPAPSSCEIKIVQVLEAQIFRGPPNLAQILERDPEHARMFQGISHGDHHLACTYKILLNGRPYQYKDEISNTLLELKEKDCDADKIKKRVTEEIIQFTSQCKHPDAQPAWGEPLKALS